MNKRQYNRRRIHRSINGLYKSDNNVRPYFYPDSRYPKEKFESLKESIRNMGLSEVKLPEITPNGGVFIGWHRVLACAALRDEGDSRFNYIYCWESSPPADVQKALSLMDNDPATGVPLTENEVEETICSLSAPLEGQGLTQREIAKLTGKSHTYVGRVLQKRKLLDQIEDPTLKEEIRIMGERKCSYLNQIIEIYEQAIGLDSLDNKVIFAQKLMSGNPGCHPPEMLEKIEIIKTFLKNNQVLSRLERILEEASKHEYMTITWSVPDDIYLPYFRLAKKEHKTIQEEFTWAARERLPEVNKWNEEYEKTHGPILVGGKMK